MPAALPSALRARFQQYIEEGLSGRAAAARLKISAATGVRWQRKLRETSISSVASEGGYSFGKYFFHLSATC